MALWKVLKKAAGRAADASAQESALVQGQVHGLAGSTTSGAPMRQPGLQRTHWRVPPSGSHRGAERPDVHMGSWALSSQDSFLQGRGWPCYSREGGWRGVSPR